MVEEIKDLVVLGRAYPEPIEDGRHTVCLGGYSPTTGYVRLYPTQRRMTQCSRWNVISAPIERDREGDFRQESYKIEGSKEDWDFLHEKIDKVGELNKSEQIELIHELATDCPAALNEEELSLGVVEPARIINYWLDDLEDPTTQLDLALNERRGKNSFPHKLYVKYRCQGCQQESPHEQHVIEYGIYKYWEKNDDPEGVLDALKLTADDYKHYFFVGNLRHHPTSFVIISDLRFKKSAVRDRGISVDDQAQLEEWSESQIDARSIRRPH